MNGYFFRPVLNSVTNSVLDLGFPAIRIGRDRFRRRSQFTGEGPSNDSPILYGKLFRRSNRFCEPDRKRARLRLGKIPVYRGSEPTRRRHGERLRWILRPQKRVREQLSGKSDYEPHWFHCPFANRANHPSTAMGPTSLNRLCEQSRKRLNDGVIGRKGTPEISCVPWTIRHRDQVFDFVPWGPQRLAGRLSEATPPDGKESKTHRSRSDRTQNATLACNGGRSSSRASCIHRATSAVSSNCWRDGSWPFRGLVFLRLSSSRWMGPVFSKEF